MNKLLVAMLFTFAICTIIAGIGENGLGLATTHLTQACDEDDFTLYVESTRGFLADGYVVIEGERIDYAGTTTTSFTGATRGGDWNAEETEPASHANNSRVYSEATNVLNSALGYHVFSSVSVFGMFSIPMPNPRIFTVTIPKMLLWDYPFLDGHMMLFKYILLYPLSAGFLMALIVVVGSVLSRFSPF